MFFQRAALFIVIAPLMLSSEAAQADLLTKDVLSLNDVKPSFEKMINGKGFRNSLKLTDIVGIHQEGKKAIVIFTVSGQESSRGQAVRRITKSECLKLNSGGWYCVVSLSEFRWSTWSILKR